MQQTLDSEVVSSKFAVAVEVAQAHTSDPVLQRILVEEVGLAGCTKSIADLAPVADSVPGNTAYYCCIAAHAEAEVYYKPVQD